MNRFWVVGFRRVGTGTAGLELRFIGWIPAACLKEMARAVAEVGLDGAVCFTREVDVSELVGRVQRGEALMGHDAAHTLVTT